VTCFTKEVLKNIIFKLNVGVILKSSERLSVVPTRYWDTCSSNLRGRRDFFLSLALFCYKVGKVTVLRSYSFLGLELVINQLS